MAKKKAMRTQVDVQTQEPIVENFDIDSDRKIFDRERAEFNALRKSEKEQKRIEAERRLKEESDRNAEEKEKFEKKRFWPKNKSLPQFHVKQTPMPCRKCRRVYSDNLSRATVLTSTVNRFAYYRCRVCGHRFKLAIVEA